MKYQADDPVPIGNGVTYTPRLAHRGAPTKHKTVWTVGLPEEVDCFRRSSEEGWLLNSTGSGLIQLANGRLATLGVNSHREDLKLARFVSPVPLGTWHGYPADYRRKPQDRPPITILSNWRLAAIIEKHQMAKIRRGQQCRL